MASYSTTDLLSLTLVKHSREKDPDNYCDKSSFMFTLFQHLGHLVIKKQDLVFLQSCLLSVSSTMTKRSSNHG